MGVHYQFLNLLSRWLAFHAPQLQERYFVLATVNSLALLSSAIDKVIVTPTRIPFLHALAYNLQDNDDDSSSSKEQRQKFTIISFNK